MFPNVYNQYTCKALPVLNHLQIFVCVSVKPQHKVDSLASNQTVAEGGDAEFYCRTEANPVATQYRWFKDGRQINNSGHYVIKQISDGESGLTVKQTNKSNAGQYSCVGENDVAIGLRKSVFLVVKC